MRKPPVRSTEPDAWTITQALIDSGKAWHVGYHAGASLYIMADRAEADAMVAHLNSFPGRQCASVRTQADVNAWLESVGKKPLVLA